MFPTASTHAVDLLEKMLHLDPDFRPNAAEAMSHPYLSAYHDESDEPISEHVNLDEGVEDDRIEEWRKRVWREIEMVKVRLCLPEEETDPIQERNRLRQHSSTSDDEMEDD